MILRCLGLAALLGLLGPGVGGAGGCGSKAPEPMPFHLGVAGGQAGTPLPSDPNSPGEFMLILVNSTSEHDPHTMVTVSAFHILGPDSQTDVEFLDLGPGDSVTVATLPAGERWSISWVSNTHPQGGLRYMQRLTGPGPVFVEWTTNGWLGEHGVPQVVCSSDQCIN